MDKRCCLENKLEVEKNILFLLFLLKYILGQALKLSSFPVKLSESRKQK